MKRRHHVRIWIAFSCAVLVTTVTWAASASAASYTRVGIVGSVRVPTATGASGASMVAIDGRGVVYAAIGTGVAYVTAVDTWAADGTPLGQLAKVGGERSLQGLQGVTGLVALDAGVVTVDGNGDVRRWDASGNVVRTWSATPLPGSPAETIVGFTGTVGPATRAPDGTLWVQDGAGAWHLDPGSGAVLGHLDTATVRGLSFANDGTTLVASSEDGDIQRFATLGQGAAFLGTIGRPVERTAGDEPPTPVAEDQFSYPSPTTPSVRADGTFWTTDHDLNRLQHFAIDGTVLDVCPLGQRTADGEVGGPVASAAAPDGTLWVAASNGLLRLGPIGAKSARCDVAPPSLTKLKLTLTGRRDRHGRLTVRKARVDFRTSEQATLTAVLERTRPGKTPVRVSTTGPTLTPLLGSQMDLRKPRTALPAGVYRVRLRAIDATGNRSERTASVRVR